MKATLIISGIFLLLLLGIANIFTEVSSLTFMFVLAFALIPFGFVIYVNGAEESCGV